MEATITLLQNDVPTTLRELQRGVGGGKPMIIDFWTTKCTRCPAAMEKLDKEASSRHKEIFYVACALSQGPGNKDVVVDMAEGNWENLTHVFMDVEAKEAAKAAWGFTSVPFYVVVDAAGNVIGTGEPKAVDYLALIDASTKTMSAPGFSNGENLNSSNAKIPTTTFTLDEDF